MKEYLFEIIVGGVIMAIITGVRGLFVRMRETETQVGTIQGAVGDLKEQSDDVVEMKVLMARIDERLRHLPTHKDLTEIHRRIDENDKSVQKTRESIATLCATSQGLRQAVDRLNNIAEKRT
ncbi:MAG: hypothetical protein F4103_05430 [Boseongicola sp. SB0673_bin_14]|nr:hypothetical protein [Boseongicola sp. SB0673_bin_14]